MTLDSLFTTVKNATKQERPASLWQEKAGFIQSAPATNAKPSETVPDVEFSMLPPSEAVEGASKGKPPSNFEDEVVPPLTTPPTMSPASPPQDSQQPQGENLQQASSQPQPANPSIQQTATQPRKSHRQRKPPQQLIAVMAAMVTATETTLHDQQIPGEIFSLQAMYPHHNDETYPILAYKAVSDPDTMYLHQAMREPDRDRFMEAMEQEVKLQMREGGLKLVHINDVPKNATILPAVWQMKRKRDIRTRKVKKWKARLNINGSRMVKHRDYDQTYAPVASWNCIRLLLILVLIFRWHTKQLDYVLAFTQAPVERELYMHIPKG